MGKFNGVQFRCDYGAACCVVQRVLSSLSFWLLLGLCVKEEGTPRAAGARSVPLWLLRMGLELLEQAIELGGWGYGFVDSLGGYALLLHRVALPQGYRAIF